MDLSGLAANLQLFGFRQFLVPGVEDLVLLRHIKHFLENTAYVARVASLSKL